MATVTWDGSTDTDYGTAANWDTGSVPTSSDDIIIANVSNDCVLDGSRSVKSFVVEAGGDFNGNTETLTVVGKNGSGYAVDIDGDIIGTTTGITVTTPDACDLDLKPTAGNVRDLTINHASCVATWTADTTLSRNLTIAAGEFKAQGAATLDVDGDVSVTGTLTGVSGAVSMGSLTIASGGTYSATSTTTTITDENTSNYAIENSGTFTHNGGTVSIETADHTSIAWSSASQRFNNLTINLGASGRAFTQASGFGDTDNKYIEGALQIINSTYNVNNQELRVDGDVSLSTNAVLNGAAGDVKFKSFTIASGTTYNATSGTTTITSRTGGTGTYALENNGTFTHNKGTVKITDADNNVSMKLGASLYNLELSGGYKKIRDNTTINNNLTLTSGDLYGHSGSLTLDVLGQTILNGGTTGQNIAFTGTMNWGNVTVNSGTLKLSSGTNNAESFRNVGGTIA